MSRTHRLVRVEGSSAAKNESWWLSSGLGITCQDLQPIGNAAFPNIRAQAFNPPQAWRTKGASLLFNRHAFQQRLFGIVNSKKKNC